MSLARPSAEITLEGGGAPSLLGGALSLAQAAVARVRIDLSVDEAHDRVELWLWRDSALAGAEPGATIEIGLGASPDTVEDVLAADVAGVDLTSWGAVLTAFAPSRKLSSTYVGRSYVDQSVADVVNDLLGEAGVDAGDIDAPLALPAHHVDPRRSAWGNLYVLARRTGHQITSEPDGAVSFGPAPGPTAAIELRDGADLIDHRAGPRGEVANPSVVNPSGGSGATWFLLSAEPDDGSSAVLVAPSLRTQEAADAATTALADLYRRRTHVGRGRLPGRPDLRAGTTITVRGDDYRITRARHVLDGRTGYVCDLDLEGAS